MLTWSLSQIPSSSPLRQLIFLTFTLVFFPILLSHLSQSIKSRPAQAGPREHLPDSYRSIDMSSSEDLTSDVRTRFSSHYPFLHLLHVWGWCATEVPSVHPNYWLRIFRRFVTTVAWMRRFYCCRLSVLAKLVATKGGQHSMMQTICVHWTINSCRATGAIDRYTDCISNLQCNASLSSLSALSRFSTPYQHACPEH